MQKIIAPLLFFLLFLPLVVEIRLPDSKRMNIQIMTELTPEKIAKIKLVTAFGVYDLSQAQAHGGRLFIRDTIIFE